MVKEKEKKLKEIEARQVTCYGCNSYRLQLVLIENLGDKTGLHLVCLNCGVLQILFTKGNSKPESYPKTKRQRTYLG